MTRGVALEWRVCCCAALGGGSVVAVSGGVAAGGNEEALRAGSSVIGGKLESLWGDLQALMDQGLKESRRWEGIRSEVA